MLNILLWFLIVSLVGWLVFPLAYRFFPGLAERGLALLRPLGLLAWGFVFWLLGSLGVIGNSGGEMLLALALVAGLSAWAGRGRWQEMRAWLKDHLGQVLFTEALFLLAFVGMVLFRAASPNITGTEKPMELAFINAILRSPGMPPNDPWLSGYAISYYYFGYVMVAMLTRLSGVVSGVGFNLAIATWFAMTATAAYGVLYNLLAAWSAKRESTQEKPGLKGIRAWALLAPLFILVLSNTGGLFEMLHSSGAFWTKDSSGQSTSTFWQGLGIPDWNEPPGEPLSLQPNRFWWWWRSSRVLQDFKLNGEVREVIDEFPNFSYFLADLHPHVLAMPFSLMLVGLMFSFYQTKRWDEDEPEKAGFAPLIDWMRHPEFWITAVALGAMGFLNIWDFPVYLVIFGLVYGLMRYQQYGWNFSRRLGDLVCFLIVMGLAGLVLYLPFYLGFTSQAGGLLPFLPSLAFFTPGVNFWIMFATLLIPLLAWLIWLALRKRGSLKHGLFFGLAVVFGLWLVSYLVGLAFVLVLNAAPDLTVSGVNLGATFYGLQGSSDGSQIIGTTLLNRLIHPGTWLTLLAVLSLAWGLMAKRKELPPAAHLPVEREHSFVLVLVLAGAGLALVPEFFYLRDDFGTRMNTVFKFYFQTWSLWAVAAAFGSVVLWNSLRRVWKVIFGVISVAVIGVGLIYPYFGILDRMGLLDVVRGNDFAFSDLDGTKYLQTANPEEWASVQWLNQAPDGVILEAVGGQYSTYARIATLTGLPNVLGWPGHEGQWRGTKVSFYGRMDEIKQFYETPDWEQAKAFLDKYHVRYIYIGGLEIITYEVNTDKFAGKISPVFQQDSVAIYEYIP